MNQVIFTFLRVPESTRNYREDMPQVNRKLADRIAGLGFTQAELARRINVEIELLTGRSGNVTDADVRRWIRGETKWPQDRIRLSLERVLSARAEDLGFVPRRRSTASLEVDPVDRRTFVTAASCSVLGAGTPGADTRGRLGVQDVRRFHQDYVAILRHDDAGQGSQNVENLAVELASRIQSALASSSASTRVRDMLHRLAAEVISSAAFALIDARAPRRARAPRYGPDLRRPVPEIRRTQPGRSASLTAASS
ncbi:hypothetical protein [Streptomyces sp. NPDC006971]|uniref:hypothetical protein n=1 Tax=Streptomyces sp. NPDC006971 TaxID=3154784 RepID=UPI00340F66CD